MAIRTGQTWNACASETRLGNNSFLFNVLSSNDMLHPETQICLQVPMYDATRSFCFLFFLKKQDMLLIKNGEFEFDLCDSLVSYGFSRRPFENSVKYALSLRATVQRNDDLVCEKKKIGNRKSGRVFFR